MNIFNFFATAGQNSASVEAAQPAADAVQQSAAQGSWLSFLPLIIIIALMFFMSIRSQKKQQAKRKEMMERMVKGSKVILASGIMGIIEEVQEKSIKVAIASNCIVEVLPNAIIEIVTEEAAAAK